MPLIRVAEYHDVELLYDRHPASNYGVTGDPYRPWIDDTFSDQTETMFGDLFIQIAQAGRGTVEAILSGGVARSGTGRSLHYTHRAFDLDGLMFASGPNWVADSFPQERHLYLGIEAVIRQHFGTVLTYMYDRRHEDHIHFDNGTRPGFNTMSKSRVLFLQNALSALFDDPVSVDGVYGPETSTAERRVRQQLGIAGLSNRAAWMDFLQASAETAFDRAARRHNSGN